MFEVGDKVSVLDENATGIVVAVSPDGKVLVDVEGFEYTYSSHQLVKSSIQSQKAYFDMNPAAKLADVARSDDRLIKPEIIRDKKKRVIDLHAGDLVASTKGWTNGEILQMQIDTFSKELYRAMQDGIISIVFVHGVGEGVLRDAIRQELRAIPGVEFLDADYRKFGFGATEVILR